MAMLYKQAIWKPTGTNHVKLVLVTWGKALRCLKSPWKPPVMKLGRCSVTFCYILLDRHVTLPAGLGSLSLSLSPSPSRKSSRKLRASRAAVQETKAGAKCQIRSKLHTLHSPELALILTNVPGRNRFLWNRLAALITAASLEVKKDKAAASRQMAWEFSVANEAGHEPKGVSSKDRGRAEASSSAMWCHGPGWEQD